MFGLFRKKRKVKHVEKTIEIDKSKVKREETEEIDDGLEEVELSTLVEEKDDEKSERKHKAVNHITKHAQGGWQIKKSGSNRALKRFRTQKEAIEYAKHLEDTTETGYIIHKATGGIRKKTY